MKKIRNTNAFMIILLLCLSRIVSAQQLTASKSFEGVFDPEHRIGYISTILKIENNYVLLDMMLRKVYMTDLNFKVTHKFDAESCHPGSAFNPMRLTQINDTKVLISSDPIRAYIFDVVTKKCSTREFAEEKFLGHGDMTRAEDGILGITHQNTDNTFTIKKYNSSLKNVSTISIKDDLPFLNLRFRLTQGNRLLYHNNRMLYLNSYDISIMFLDLNSTTKQISRVVKPIPISGLNKTRTDMSTSARNEMNFTNMLAPLKGRHIAGSMSFMGNDHLLIKISTYGVDGGGSIYYKCDINLNSCNQINFNGKGGLFYADQHEMIFMLASDENPIMHRYTLK